MEIKQSANAGERVTLDQALIGETLAVLRVQAPELASEWGRWLEEIGFIPGEQVRLIDRTADEAIQGRVRTLLARQVEPLVVQVSNARGEAEPQ